MTMGVWVNHSVAAKGIDKMQAGILAIEFWTGKGFKVHSSTYNHLVLRRSGYGQAGHWIESLFGGEKEWHDMPLRLTILIQWLPTNVKYELKFETSRAWDVKLDDFSDHAGTLVGEFISFINQWVSHGQQALEE